MGEVVLSFHEALLHKSDVELLKGPYWLNDTIISFYLEYLEKVRFSGAKNLLFISPEVTQCIKMVPTEEIGAFLDPLGIKNKKVAFFPLNDNDRPDISGGSHWSLLVYSKDENSFFHLDSSAGSNHDVAWSFASHIIPYFTRTGSVNFMAKDCIQQNNGYDCGIHVICNIELIAEHALIHNNVETCNMDVKYCSRTKRAEILDIIYQLAGDS